MRLFWRKAAKAEKAERKTNRTELVFLLDRSGSMNGLERDTIGGYNSMLDQQKREPGEANVTTVLFDQDYELLHDRLAISHVPPMTAKEYQVRGCTALLDAIGMTIRRIADVQKHTVPEKRADKVLFVIITDGMENASRAYTYEKVQAMVAQEKKKYGWEFLFLGANIDAIATAARVGIGADRAVNYHADSRGVALNYEAVSGAISHIRACAAPMGAEWKASIEKDFASRGTHRQRR
ncbi:MAG: VWA domain-containing protein [Eubacteriales bacterium]|nr:VWA domain-containing protein [Eubacteriales bacterium]